MDLRKANLNSFQDGAARTQYVHMFSTTRLKDRARQRKRSRPCNMGIFPAELNHSLSGLCNANVSQCRVRKRIIGMRYEAYV